MVRGAQRGSTIVEIMIFAGILLGLMVVLTTFLVQGRRYARQTESYGYAQREATKIIRKLSDDLYRATQVHSNQESSRMYFLSSLPDSGGPPVRFDPNTGKTFWNRWVYYSYDTTNRTVVRATIPLDTPTSTLGTIPQPSVAFSDFASAPDLRPIGVGVESLTITSIGSAVYQVEVKTRFTGTSAAAPSNRSFAEVSLAATIRLPNQN